jgi:hypothetical protein
MMTMQHKTGNPIKLITDQWIQKLVGFLCLGKGQSFSSLNFRKGGQTYGLLSPDLVFYEIDHDQCFSKLKSKISRRSENAFEG